MDVYKGMLLGGPDHGNSVSSSVSRIKTKTTTELWLDGDHKSSVIVLELGSYYWNPEQRNFKWHAESIDFFPRKQLQAA